MKKSEFLSVLNEGYDADSKEKVRFKNFINELTKLSKKYSIVIQGNYYYYDEGDILSLAYSNDPTSGDIYSTVKTRD